MNIKTIIPMLSPWDGGVLEPGVPDTTPERG